MEGLNTKQREIAQRALKGEHLFITGSAGTGKSYLLKALVQEFLKKYKHARHVAITAMTGIASVSIDGRTLHSFAGMGHDHSKAISWEAKRRWMQTRVLIVDEVSMLTDKFLERLWEPISQYKIQVIFFGDFYQLPPINGKPCFKSSVWKTLGLHRNTVELTKVIRQKDNDFVKVLNEIRIGEISPESIEFLRNLDISKKKKDIHKSTTKLYTVNRNVDTENYKRLDRLESPLIVLTAVDRITKGKQVFSTPPRNAPFLLGRMDREAPMSIELKVGAEVILTRNRPDGILVNGSRGIIKEFQGSSNIPIVEFKVNNVEEPLVVPISPIEYEVKDSGYKMTRLQTPLKLCWAVTVHRAQGMTLPLVLASLHSSFEVGQCYVALSRSTCPDGLVIDDVDTLIHRNKVCPLAKKYYESVKKYQNPLKDMLIKNIKKK